MKYAIYKNGQPWGKISLTGEEFSVEGGQDFKDFINSILKAKKTPDKVFEYLRTNRSSYIQVEDKTNEYS